jgi:hypothetical protein
MAGYGTASLASLVGLANNIGKAKHQRAVASEMDVSKEH